MRTQECVLHQNHEKFERYLKNNVAILKMYRTDIIAANSHFRFFRLVAKTSGELNVSVKGLKR